MINKVILVFIVGILCIIIQENGSNINKRIKTRKFDENIGNFLIKIATKA